MHSGESVCMVAAETNVLQPTRRDALVFRKLTVRTTCMPENKAMEAIIRRSELLLQRAAERLTYVPQYSLHHLESPLAKSAKLVNHIYLISIIHTQLPSQSVQPRSP